MMNAMLSRITILLSTLLLSSSLAATCTWSGITPPERASAAPTGYDFVAYFQRGLRLIEPSLPRLQRVDMKRFAAAPSEALLSAAKYVAERKLVPSNWSEQVISPEAWRRAVEELYAWYHVPASPPPWPRTVAELETATAKVFETVGAALRPVLLIATDPDDPERISFWAYLWNWTPYPRVIVFPPNPHVRTSKTNIEAMRAVSNCLVTVEYYIVAEENVARSLFLGHYDSEVQIIQTEPASELAGLVVPAGKEIDVFLFQYPGMETLESVALTFSGPSAGVFDILGGISKVKTNIGIFNFSHMFALPH